MKRFVHIFTLTLIITTAASSSGSGRDNVELNIPPLLDAVERSDGVREFHLVADEGRRRFFSNRTTPTLGYNGDYLGPTIRVRQGERIAIRVDNELDDPTTVHWHGADVPAEADGGPHQIIEAGETWIPEFTVVQQAATLWYHPHYMGTTAKQVYEGLAGMFIIDDEFSDTVDLPREYGINDIPIILQERRFDDNGSFRYAPRMPDVMHGYFGNTMLVNGDVEPFVSVPRAAVRLRLLNGSNSTILRVSFDDERIFHQVGSDGGFLGAPVPHQRLILSPGERAEIIVDFAGDDAVETELVVETNAGARYDALQFRPTGPVSESWPVPKILKELDPPDENEADSTRKFIMATAMGGRMTINGKEMEMGRIDERVALGATEIWEIENRDAGMGRMMAQPHNFHVHAVQFRILDINGNPPPPHLSGWKDTVLLWPGDRVRILSRFASYPGLYMYHCHLLEHEDTGMMGQFLIE